MDTSLGDLRRGDVLVVDGEIAEVAPMVEVADCDVIDAAGMVVMPGLVESHRHLWYPPIRGSAMDHVLGHMVDVLWPGVAAHYTPDDLYVCTKAGIAEALDNGITTVFDWCHVLNSPDHAAEAVRAHMELPMRAVFAYGASMRRKLDEFEGHVKHADSWAPARRLRENELASHPRLSMALALQGPEATTLEMTEPDVALARELNVPMSMHVGIPEGPPGRRGVATLAQAGLLGPDMQFVHCCATSDDEFRLIADAGAVVTTCPMAELGLSMGTPPIGRMRAAGLPLALGADAVCTASGDLFDEARTGLFYERARRAQARYAQGLAADDASQLGLSAREALEAITINAARACWLDDRVGSLTPGKAADIILLCATDLNLLPLSDAVGTIVCCAHGANVDSVIVGGRIVKRAGVLVDIDIARIEAEVVACRDRLYAAGSFAGVVPAPGVPAQALGSS
jgi:cytosine/adenosine deaminase-related metal-dependent hydrolase